MGPPVRVLIGSTCPRECQLSPDVRRGGRRDRIRAWGSRMCSAPTACASDHAGNAREAAHSRYAATKEAYQPSVRVRLCALRPRQALARATMSHLSPHMSHRDSHPSLAGAARVAHGLKFATYLSRE